LLSFPELKLAPVCELPWATLLNIAAQTAVQAEQINFEYAGVNHLGWFYQLATNSRNVLNELAHLRNRNGEFPGGDTIRQCAGFPTSYLKLHYFPDAALGNQTSQVRPRAAILEELSAKCLGVYAYGSREEILASLGSRGAPWYSLAIGPMILALSAGEASPPIFLSVPNHGLHPGLRDDDVLEVPHDFRAGEFVPRKPAAPLPAGIRDPLRKFLEYDRLATEAVLAREPEGLPLALRVHPWMEHSPISGEMIRDIVSNNEP
jgi:6-phospho-beta-glucosidase